MAISSNLRKYLNSEAAKTLIAQDNLTEFILQSFSIIPLEDARQLINLLCVKYDDIFGELNELVAGLFTGATTIGNVSLNSDITIIPSQCFSMSSIKGLDGQNVTIVSAKAFSGCGHLEKVNLPKLEVIGSGAFKDCISIKSFDMPKTVKRVGMNAFTGCNSLSQIHYHGTIEEAKNIEWAPKWDGTMNSSDIKVICTDGVL